MSLGSQSSTLHVPASTLTRAAEKSIGADPEESGEGDQEDSAGHLYLDGGVDAWMTVAGT
jgi:hypothetical protein